MADGKSEGGRVDRGRRRFIRQTALASAAPVVVGRLAWADGLGGAEAGGGPAALPRVVHVHHGRAARWPRTTGKYRDFLDQPSIDRMLDQAVMVLKDAGLDEAWRRVFPLGAPATRKLAIKINLNNATDPVEGAGDIIDAVPEPCIAVIKGFVRAGGLSSNCTIYDATNTQPTRYMAPWFKNRVKATFPDVKFHAAGGGEGFADGENDPWDGPSGDAADPRTYVTWSPAYATAPPDTRIAAVVLSADYLVNVPIVKKHGQANVTLGYKAHLGSIDRADRLHPWLFSDVPEASVLADIMGSPVVPGDPSVKSLAQKTVLTVGDLLYGQPCKNFGVTPRPWAIFRNEWPSHLVVSDDPVAADSVMIDILEAEPANEGGCGSSRSWARRYLQFAEAKGQGVHEHVALPQGQRFDPARMTYARIDYRFVELSSSGALLTVSKLANGAVLLQWTHYFPGPCEVWRATQPDFSDALMLGASPVGSFVDNSPLPKAYYSVLYGG
jgi:hypothetical protein